VNAYAEARSPKYRLDFYAGDFEAVAGSGPLTVDHTFAFIPAESGRYNFTGPEEKGRPRRSDCFLRVKSVEIGDDIPPIKIMVRSQSPVIPEGRCFVL
jgi:hypothetical protein